MAAIHPDAAPGSSTPASRRSIGSAPIARSLDFMIALACLMAGLVIARGYPIAPKLVMTAFIAWAACATWRFSFALPALFAAVPVIGFATWTGWLTFEEVDLLILASAAGGYLARAAGPARGRVARDQGPMLSIASIALLALLFASTCVALERGVLAAGGWHFGFLDGYDGALNSLRIFKSLAFALLITPLVIGELRTPGGMDRIGLGLTVSLALATLAVLDERLAFTGLLDFSDDYRVTGRFWEMHIGGAALDGFLMLTLPFAVREAIRHANPARFVAALAVVGLAAYAVLVTFSRGVYLAAPIALVVLAWLLWRQRRVGARGASWMMLGKGLVFTALVACASFFVFRHGGYRGAAAVLSVLALAIPGEAAMRRTHWISWGAALVAAVLVGIGGSVIAQHLQKGPYLVFVVAFAAMVAAIARDDRRPTQRSSTTVVFAWLWLAAAAIEVAGHWGGAPARDDSVVVTCGLVVALFAASRLGRPLWAGQRRGQLATIGFGLVVAATVIVFTAGAYMGGRFAASQSNLDDRLGHWHRGIGRLHDADWLVGKGLGRFPGTSVFEAVDGAAQGHYGLRTREGETFMTLVGPRLPYLGFDELFRLSQRVSVTPHTPYTAVIRARAAKPTGFHIELCEKQLLYHGACRIMDIGMPAMDAGWQTIVYRFDSGEIGEPHWSGKRPAFFAVGVGDPLGVVDIQSMHITGPDGTDLIANGAFTDRTARWFSQSDKYHLPWHIKNIALDVLFDQGAIGLALFVLLTGGALIRTAVGHARYHPDAPYVATALAGYLVVGVFDSLLDVPRVAFLFYVVVILGLALRNPPVTRAPQTPSPADANVDAAARSLRRQRAFGDRQAP